MSLLPTLSNALDTELKAALDFKLPPPDDYARMLYYHLGWIDEGQPTLLAGKRTRPTLTLLCAAASGGEWQNALPFAACVELIHNFSLVHDDIQDDSPLRRGRATVWKIWGAAQAINAGDALFNYAHLALNRARQRNLESEIILEAFQLIHTACYELTLGQHHDMAFEKYDTVSTAEYLQMIAGKTASLIATSAELGALAGKASKGQREAYRAFGYHLGTAFQIRDDILGIWGDEAVTGKSAATDIVSRKKSLPVLYGLTHSTKLPALYRLPTQGGAPVAEIIAELEQCGARTYTEEKEKHHADLAFASLAQAQPKGEAGKLLNEMTQQLLGRTN